MREIEFRAKQADTKNWVYGDVFRDYIPESDIPYWYINIRTKDQGTIPENVIPTTVGQYTGLKDKNGTKIFEGDIVKTSILYEIGCYPHAREEIVEVKYIEGCFYPLYNYERGKIEVIGNIYDNPELLESSVE